ncbi:MAG: exodeoxyribonuclease VII large subunit [Firmicutes bacterium]|nr:exodeoxyribonuclease VII large subunit [Bacillota bacterium]
MAERVSPAIPVSKLNSYLKAIISAEELLFNIQIFGEVFDVRHHNGNIYFSLKDDEASIKCTSWGGARYGLDKLIVEGEKVILTGSPSFYEKQATISFTVSKVEKKGELGDAYKRFLELKEKLEKLGFFDKEKKKPIPKQISKIGVVTSKDGAVIQDIINIRNRRNPLLEIVVYNSSVQGATAPKEISDGVRYLDALNLDVIIVARGGGSADDLSCFNDEQLAEVVFKATTPIISAVGHETDFTIIDFVADLRAPTPSAAAELVSQNIREQLSGLTKRFAQSVQEKIKEHERQKEDVAYIRKDLIRAMEGFITDKKTEVKLINEKLEKFNPSRLLKLGYSQVLKEGKLAKFESIKVGDSLDVYMSEGIIVTEVKNVKEKKK